MSYCPIEDKFMNDVWDALKADASDLRKQQRILRAYRVAHPREMTEECESILKNSLHSLKNSI